MDDPLDFENEDLLINSHVPSKRKKKVIGLDDLVKDFLQEKKKKEIKLKRAKDRVRDYSDDDDDSKLAKVSKGVNKCEEEMAKMGGDDDIQLWGLRVFGDQKTWPPIVCDIKNCKMLQSFKGNKLNSMVGLDIDKGDTFLENMLVNGWLLRLACTQKHVEIAIATWTSSLLLYSSDARLSASACEFWTAILLPEEKVKIEWLPTYSELIGALENFGFLSEMQSDSLIVMDSDSEDSESVGPPLNIGSWIKYVTACMAAGSTYSIFSVSEAEELAVVIICLFLDRQLLGLSGIMTECLVSSIYFFTDNEWNDSCGKVAKSLSSRVPKDTNCLRTVESMRRLDARTKQLKHAVAFEMLVSCLDNKSSEAEEILRQITAVNVKDKKCDLCKMYLYLVLTENWLLSNPIVEDSPHISKMFGIFLRHCSCHILSADLRAYASKIRNKASYLLSTNSF